MSLNQITDEDVTKFRKQIETQLDQMARGILQLNKTAGKFQRMFATAASQQVGSQQQRWAIVRARVKKFFQYHVDLQNGYLQPRRDVGDSRILPLTLLLYGADFLSTKKLKTMFGRCVNQIIWIDSSHCKLVFENLDGVQKFFGQQLLEQNGKHQIGWMQLKRTYYELNFQRKLFIRHATEKQQQIQIKKFQSFVGYHFFKRQFQKSFPSDKPRQVIKHVRCRERNHYQSKKKNNRFQDYSRSRNKQRYHVQKREKIKQIQNKNQLDSYELPEVVPQNQEISMSYRLDKLKIDDDDNDDDYQDRLSMSMKSEHINYSIENKSWDMEYKQQQYISEKPKFSYKNYERDQQIKRELKKKQIQYIDLQNQNQW